MPIADVARARITVVQLEEAHTGESEACVAQMRDAVERHAASDLIVFPELALHGHKTAEWSPAQVRRALASADAHAVEELDALAARKGTCLVYGELAERDGRLYNLATFVSPTERVSYAKTHVHWSERFEPGNEFPVARSFRVPVGMLICFDAAFPEVPRALALAGAEIIVNISAIPASFPLKHVHRRVVACSVENQVFTVFANRAGEDCLGGSAVVDPTGDILAVAGETGDLTVDVDLDAVRAWREAEPLFAHRRPSLYSPIAR